jgi:hypothetical protein
MGLNLHQSVRDALPVRLGDRKYNIDPARLERSTIDPIRQGFDTQGSPGEQSLNQAGVWKRTRDDWSLGAGQLNADTQDSSPRRFNASTGVDVWTENEVSLLPTVTLKKPLTATNQYMATANDGSNDYIYVCDGSNVQYSTNIGATWATPISAPAGGAIVSAASDGANLYVASTAGGKIQEVSGAAATGNAWTLASVDGVWVANGYLFGSVGSRLYEGSDFTSTDVTDSSFTQVTAWKDVIGTPVGVFATGTKGDKSRVYYIGINDSNTSLLPPVISAELPDGELVNTLAYYGGMVIIGTTRGVRLATINGSGYLSYGPVIEITGGVSYLEPQGEFVWFNWDNYDSPFDATARTGLGRLGLKEFTGTIVPAYASDLMAETTGLIQGIITTTDGRRMFTVSGDGAYLETTATKELNGYIDEGRFRWGITELKALVSSDIRHTELNTSQSVVLSVTTDDYINGIEPDATIVSTSDTKTAVAETVGVTGLTGEWFTPELKLSHSGGPGPALKRWTLRAIPMPYVSEVVSLPIILATQTRHDNRDVYIDTFDDYTYLKTLMENRTLVTFEMGSESTTVYVAGVSYAAGSIAKWSDDGNWFEGTITVQVVTVQGL